MNRVLFFILFLLPLLSGAQTEKNFLENTIKTLEKTGINTPMSDFGPVFVENELWFSSYSEEEMINSGKRKKEDSFYKLFTLPIDHKGNISGEKNIKLEDVRAGYHVGPVSYCQATGELFVTLSNFENPLIQNVVFQKANIPLKIIILKNSGNNWIPAGELPFNSSTFSVGHPAISVTGDTLIFASDMPEKGKGGTDLYMTVRKNGKWGEMINLGDKINTAGNEMFPYLHKGKFLFFASDGITGGLGELDIYYTELKSNGFDNPKNLKELNSPADDFGLVIHANEEVGYFVSQRSGGAGDDDIYKVLFEGTFDLELLVLDKKSSEPIANAKVNFSNNTTLFTDNEGVIKMELKKETDYTATSDVQGYMNESVSFTTGNLPFGTLKEVIQIEKVEVGQKFVMENIYYDFDKWEISPESEAELNKLVKVMKDNPSWKVELGSHTDSRGTHDYNETLSQKRSDSAINYIVSQGISKNRITAKGYGETQLVNECKDGVSCTEEQHQQNRRTEFTILEMD
ncbi:MAG: OmpA family protein [Mariniphaga sp.]|nr:OmpA family protein [Mariniphaga sp.]